MSKSIPIILIFVPLPETPSFSLGLAGFASPAAQSNRSPEDTDAGGVVYHSNYLKYFERGRTEYLRDRGFSVEEMARRGFVFPVVHLEIDYHAPALHDDLFRVETAVLEIKKSSLTFAHQVLRISDERLLVTGIVNWHV